MKKIKNLKGVKELNKTEQQAVKGGKIYRCRTENDCPPGYGCLRGICVWAV